MARRSTVEKLLYVVDDTIAAGSGVIELVAPDADSILAPKMAVISAHGGGNFEYEVSTNGGVFLHAHTPSNDSLVVNWPDGFELPKGSGISMEGLTNDGSINLYYCIYDEGAGVTKVASRAATFSNVTVTRAPNAVLGQAQS